MFVQENTVKSIRNYLITGLSDLYPAEEVDSMVRILFEHYHGWNRIDLSRNQDEKLSESDLLNYHWALKELQNYQPIQYVLGQTEFYGLPFVVNEHVLIPRPETEELVKLIIDENSESKSLIDVGSGSGCISVSYKNEKPDSYVLALDVDPNALAVVERNCLLNNIEIDRVEMDILNWRPLGQKFDIVVSNPPYVLDSEKTEMNRNVLDYEPHLALFVPDKNPIVFYERIADFSLAHMVPGGKIYFEINERYGNSVADCLQIRNFKDIRIIKDINGKERIVAAHS